MLKKENSKGQSSEKKILMMCLLQASHIHYTVSLPRGPARPHTSCHQLIQQGVTAAWEADFGFTVLKEKKSSKPTKRFEKKI